MSVLPMSGDMPWTCSILVVLLCLAACARPAAVTLPTTSADVLVIPGCPTLDDGTVSRCQWRRALWAAELVGAGRADTVIVSGSAVHNRFGEAEGLAAALVALGVPAQRVVTETQALHTDENIAYSLHLASALGCSSVMVAGEGGFQTNGICSMARRWGWPCIVAPPPRRSIHARLEAGVPVVQVAGEDAATWRSGRDREVAWARAEGRPARPRSPFKYLGMAVLGESGAAVPIPRPPVPEPSLAADAPRCAGPGRDASADR